MPNPSYHFRRYDTPFLCHDELKRNIALDASLHRC